jgi:uncharacterized protein YndB with AHSA1/START domain
MMSQATKPKQATRMSDAAVQARTGKTWAEWFALLDADGARKMNHKEIVALLRANHGVGPWWQQMVTVTYEQARGLREKHETPAGYQISVTKTIAVPVATLFQAWADEKIRRRWLRDHHFTVRKATPGRFMRITWVDGKTNVEAMFYPRGAQKSQISAQHNKLASARQAAQMKKYWTEMLERLKEILDGN